MPVKLGRDRPDDGLDMARGVVVGMFVGLGFWVAVLVFCAVIA